MSPLADRAILTICPDSVNSMSNYTATYIDFWNFFCSIHIVHDEVKDKSFELEMSWVGEGMFVILIFVLKRVFKSN